MAKCIKTAITGFKWVGSIKEGDFLGGMECLELVIATLPSKHSNATIETLEKGVKYIQS